jgi:acetate kinase
MRFLTVNAGSTSLKLAVIDDGVVVDTPRSLDAALTGPPPYAIAHRVVHGGDRTSSVLVDNAVLAELHALTELAPLHQPPALDALERCRAAWPGVPQIACFDTAFHATIPPVAHTYAVPARWREEFGVRRYGFQGISVQWSAEQVPVRRLVVCHLGGGSSVTAVLDGRSIDTTMGMTPLEGVPMATRSGSVDPGVLVHLLRERGLSVDELDHALERESGLLGLGGSEHVRELGGTLALDVYVYRVAAAAAAMAAALGGIDAIAFTGGIGENSEPVRRAIVERLAFLGDFRVEVVRAREDVVIARAVRALLAA